MRSCQSFFPLLLLTGASLAQPYSAVAGVIIGSTTILDSAYAANASIARPGWMAVGFTMGATAYVLTGARVEIQNQGPKSGSPFSAALWSNNGGVPGTDLLDFSFSATNSHIDLTAPSPFTLDAGTSYWVMVVGSGQQLRWQNTSQTPQGPGGVYLGIEQSPQGVGSAPGANPIAGIASVPGTPPFFEVDGDPVNSSSPEPGSMTLLATALAALLAVRRLGKGPV